MTLPGPRTLIIGVVFVTLLGGCGRKSPPLAPLVRLPAPVSELVIQRMGSEVFIGFTLPVQNQDGTQPADLERVDVYAMTVQPHFPADRRLNLEEFQEAATIVASVEVAPPSVASLDDAGEQSGDDLPLQGFPVAFSEEITPSLLVPMDPWEEERRRRLDDEDDPPEELVQLPLMAPPQPGPLQRRYAVVGVSTNGNESEPAERIAVPLVAAPFAPPSPIVTYGEEVVDITWGLPIGARRCVQDTTGTTAPSGVTGWAGSCGPQAATGRPVVATGATDAPDGPMPLVRLISRPTFEWPPASRFDLFEIVESVEEQLVMPRPLNMTPLLVPTYTETRVETDAPSTGPRFGVERCYAVSTVDVVAGLDIRSTPSVPTCVTFLDTFAPDAPTGLTAVGSDGAVSLIWQPNQEEDLGGYLVLRGAASGETLQPLTARPVLENTFRDTSAVPGVRYVYAVQAVDDVALANVSVASAQVEAAAR